MDKDKKYALLDTDFLYKYQTDYKVWSIYGHQRISVPIQQVYDEIYDGKFQLLKNGDLKYIK